MEKPLAILVHGMARSNHSWWCLSFNLRKAGFECLRFGYAVARESFEEIVDRLADRLRSSAGCSTVAIGHSLGGVLLRTAMAKIEAHQRPRCLVMLGTPNHSPRLARQLRERAFFRCLYGDSGQLLGNPERMESLPPVLVPTLLIVGTRGKAVTRRIFGDDPNDGIVSLDEASLEGVERLVQPVGHTFMMNDPGVRREVVAFCLRWLPAE